MKRQTYTPIRIDFTPFVNVALLLIVFFVWLKTVQRENVMQMNIPGGIMCYYGWKPKADANLFLLDNNRIGFLNYNLNGVGPEFIETDYSAAGIKNQLISITLNHNYGAIVLITPTKLSTFKNLVDILDEVRMTGHIKFCFNDVLTPAEQKLIASYERYKNAHPTTALFIHRAFYTQSVR
ncbi:biopolymer transporter ExbD [Spirosoma validum]|uniref:Biopolymer transporter ExbD n=1 Tax=Spirosoma validum TaxID=2771355 RepID=A0A927AXJ3_9BACT|nr:biopolymer transporter ExbD [Spirosoma validum]MBD2751608.1 biopolymer transporter ExbD [Spirosoma validum]